MKLKTVVGLVMIVGFASLLFLNFGQQVGGYMSFAEAEQSGSKAHVVGYWVKAEGSSYDPAQNLFSFYMKDDQGTVRQVKYANPKPASFEDAEKLVVEGYLQDDVFVAEHILMKCPSKYNDGKDIEQVSDASS